MLGFYLLVVTCLTLGFIEIFIYRVYAQSLWFRWNAMGNIIFGLMYSIHSFIHSFISIKYVNCTCIFVSVLCAMLFLAFSLSLSLSCIISFDIHNLYVINCALHSHILNTGRTRVHKKQCETNNWNFLTINPLCIQKHYWFNGINEGFEKSACCDSNHFSWVIPLNKVQISSMLTYQLFIISKN